MAAADYGHCICLSAHIENLYRTKCEVEFGMMLGRSEMQPAFSTSGFRDARVIVRRHRLDPL